MQDLQKKLNQYAIIIRKYNLGDKNFFTSEFPHIDKTYLETAWTYAQTKIQNREIIKNASILTIEELKLASLQINSFDNKTENLYYRLNNKFDVKELNLKNENIERKVRNALSVKYLQNLLQEITELQKKEVNPFKAKAGKIIGKLKYGLIAVGIIGIISAPRVIDGLTPVETLTQKIHEKSKYKFSGSICRDGHTSHSQGRGTCSWHGGVAYKFYKGDYRKTIEECRAEAIKLSWRD